MSEVNKITDEELQTLVEIQQRNQLIVTELGKVELDKLTLETRRTEIERALTELRSKEQEFVTTIRDTYGNISLDVATGEFTLTEEPAE